jgi:hypothetical protein
MKKIGANDEEQNKVFERSINYLVKEYSVGDDKELSLMTFLSG